MVSPSWWTEKKQLAQRDDLKGSLEASICGTCSQPKKRQGRPSRAHGNWSEIPFWPPCFYCFLDPVWGDGEGLLAFEALQGDPSLPEARSSLKVAAHVLVKRHQHCFAKNAHKRLHIALAPNPRVLLGSCASSSAVSVGGLL